MQIARPTLQLEVRATLKTPTFHVAHVVHNPSHKSGYLGHVSLGMDEALLLYVLDLPCLHSSISLLT